LLKAGLVDKKSKKRADHRARVKRTEKKKKGVDEEKEQEKKTREYEEKEEKRRRKDKEREQARLQEQQERERKLAKEQAHKEAEKREESEQLQQERRARDLLQASMFLPQAEGPVAFNFVSRSGGIRKLQVTTRIAHDLRSGQLAIAQLPGAERFGLVRRDVAEQLMAVDASLVRFFVTDPEEELIETPPIDDDM
jgi:uncharacterized protein YaiL (DUF2058 family)